MGIHLSNKLLVYSLVRVFDMVSSRGFNISMFIWSLPVAAHFSYLLVLPPPPMLVYLVLISGQCGLWYSVHCRIARCRIPLIVSEYIVIDA